MRQLLIITLSIVVLNSDSRLIGRGWACPRPVEQHSVFIRAGASPAPTVVTELRKPNIIFILADDLGYGDIGCYGQKKISTPNIDRLAKMGTRFTDFYSASAVCAPARCSFMTGLHQGHAAIRGNLGMKPEGQFPLPESEITIASLLQQNGYQTAAFGKWSLGFITTSGDPQKKGFNEFYGYNCQSLAHDYYPDHLWNNHERIELPGNLKSDSAYSADMIHQQAMNFLSTQKSKPFFLYLPYTLPHADLNVPHDAVYDRYFKQFNSVPHASFAAMVSRLDKYVGEIMQLIKKKGLEENTMIIFTSDNGPHKEGGGDPDFFNSSAGFRGIKRDLYEGGIREPFIVYMKGMTKPGSVCTLPAVLYDLYPTFLAFTQISGPSKTDGQSLIPSFMGKNQREHRYIYWELQEGGGKQALRVGDWKLVKLNVMTEKNPTLELYNLKLDPGEKKNVADANSTIAMIMNEMTHEAHVANKTWPLIPEDEKK